MTASSPLSFPCPAALIEALLAEIALDANGLVPAIAQQHDSKEILMMAWMNTDALRETLATGYACYWSRSRQALWRKGETSGQHQRIVDVRWDCDGDTIVLLVEQTGVACHTGRYSCFYRAIRAGTPTDILAVEKDPDALYGNGI